MKQENISLENTNISFTPSFSGNGWETSLLPQFERGHTYGEYRITLSFLKKMLLKMQEFGQRLEVKQWTTAIVRLFL